MKNWLEKQFRLSEFNTNIKTELLAGLTKMCIRDRVPVNLRSLMQLQES